MHMRPVMNLAQNLSWWHDAMIAAANRAAHRAQSVLRQVVVQQDTAGGAVEVVILV